MIDVKLSEERKAAILRITEEFIRYDNVNFSIQAALIYELRKLNEALAVLLNEETTKIQNPKPSKNKKQSSV